MLLLTFWTEGVEGHVQEAVLADFLIMLLAFPVVPSSIAVVAGALVCIWTLKAGTSGTKYAVFAGV